MASETAFLLDLGVLAVASLVFSLAFARFKLPIVTGQILAGMLVGPYVLGWVVDQTIIAEISSVGIVLLLFIIGLETDPLELRRMANRIVLLVILEVGVSFAFGFEAASVLGLNLVLSIIFAMAVSISSTAIVGKIIMERRMFRSEESKVLVGLLVIEDIVAVGFLISLSTITQGSFVGPSQQLSQIILTGVGGVVLLVAGYVIARFLAPYAIDYLSGYETEFEEIPFLFALALGLIFAVVAAVLGYSPGIGAFIIGLSIRGKQSRFLFEKLTPLKDLFLVMFFVSMGSLINPFPALAIGLPVLLVMALIVAGKFLGGMAVGWSLQRDGTEGGALPLSFGAWLVPRGEFSLIIGQFALTVGLIDTNLFSLIGLSVLVTAIVGPLLHRFFAPRLAEAIHLIRPETD